MELHEGPDEEGEGGVADPDEDHSDFSTRSEHDSASEEEADMPKHENFDFFSDDDVPSYVGKDQ